jgi:hypothetical protein
MGMPRAAQALAPRARLPQGFASEAYLNRSSQGAKPEDARQGGHIRGRSTLFMKHPGQGIGIFMAQALFQILSEARIFLLNTYRLKIPLLSPWTDITTPSLNGEEIRERIEGRAGKDVK